MFSGKTFVLFSTMDFADLPTRKQRIALSLSKNNKVLYFEPPNTILSIFFNKKNKVFNERKINNNLLVIKLPYILPFGLRSLIINRINSFLLEIFIRKILNDLNYKNYILLTYLVDFPYLYKKLKPDLIVYDCIDDHSSYQGLRSKKFVSKCEEQVARISQVIFATTEELAKKLKKYNSNIYVISNGVDYNFFAYFENKTVLKELITLKKPIIGYFGAIKEWFDLDAIIFSASHHKKYSFVMVGPYNKEIKKKVENIDNIYLLGKKPYNLAPSYISFFDVCLIPFKINELTLNVSPLKLYEYFSLGKPVVTIPMYELLKYSDLLYFYSTKEELIFSIERALNDNDKNLKEKRKLIAKENSWDSKFNFMFEKIELNFN